MNETTLTSWDAILLLALMLSAWGLLAFDLCQIVTVTPGSGEERYSRGWEMLWAFALCGVVWILLGLLLYRQQATGWLLVGLLSGAAAFCGLVLMEEGRRGWAAAIPLALPVVLAGLSFSRYWAAARLAVLLVSLIPCLMLAGSTVMESLSRDRLTREKNLAMVRTIGEDQPLWTWLKLLDDEESGVRAETLEAMRHLKRRQADVEQMLDEGMTGVVEFVPELDLQLSPRLLGLLSKWFLREAEYGRTMPGGGDEILERTFFFTPVPVMRWVQAQGGDCREGVRALRAAAMLYKDTPVRRKLVGQLDGILGEAGSR